jgi:hypothetical protein
MSMSIHLAGSNSRAIASAALALCALATPAALGAPGGEPKAVSIADLKRAYLACARAALRGPLDGGAIMRCSVVYEELKERGFYGDFEKLLTWFRAQPPLRSVGP